MVTSASARKISSESWESMMCWLAIGTRGVCSTPEDLHGTSRQLLAGAHSVRSWDSRCTRLRRTEKYERNSCTSTEVRNDANKGRSERAKGRTNTAFCPLAFEFVKL